jgi:hypothetical protein
MPLTFVETLEAKPTERQENLTEKSGATFLPQALVSSNWRLESLQYKRFNKAGEFGVSPPKLILFQ